MRAWRLVQSTVARCDNRGAWLDVEGEEILLPRREVPDEVHGGESVEV